MVYLACHEEKKNQINTVVQRMSYNILVLLMARQTVKEVVAQAHPLDALKTKMETKRL